MTDDDPDRDLFAAEYVLGTLDGRERVRAEALRSSDADFEAAVRAWELRLAPLMEIGQGIEAPGWLIASILAEIEGKRLRPDGTPDNVVKLTRQVRAWRVTAGFAAALAALLGLWIATLQLHPAQVDRRNYVAILQGSDKAPSFLVSLDLARRRMVVVPSSTPATSDKSYELWIIDGQAPAPRSLGLLDAHGAAHPVLPPLDPTLISHATYAVTIEPSGGSPTGKPTSQPVYTGQLVDAAF